MFRQVQDACENHDEDPEPIAPRSGIEDFCRQNGLALKPWKASLRTSPRWLVDVDGMIFPVIYKFSVRWYGMHSSSETWCRRPGKSRDPSGQPPPRGNPLDRYAGQILHQHYDHMRERPRTRPVFGRRIRKNSGSRSQISPLGESMPLPPCPFNDRIR